MRIIFLLLICFSMRAQEDATVTAPEFYRYRMETKERFENIELNLQKHSEVYYNGLAVALIGVAVNTLSIPLLLNDAGLIFVGVGTALTIGGTITMWTSHKYIRRAGKRK